MALFGLMRFGLMRKEGENLAADQSSPSRIRRGLGYAVGLDRAKRLAERSRRDAEILRTIGATAFSTRVDASNPRAPLPGETFNQFVKRLGLTKVDLQKRIETQRSLCGVNLALTGILVMFGLHGIVTSSSISDAVVALAMLGFAVAFVTQAAAASFRIWQIRNRRLDGWREWLRAPSEWLPS